MEDVSFGTLAYAGKAQPASRASDGATECPRDPRIQSASWTGGNLRTGSAASQSNTGARRNVSLLIPHEGLPYQSRGCPVRQVIHPRGQ
jgi:hypothetical protein